MNPHFIKKNPYTAGAVAIVTILAVAMFIHSKRKVAEVAVATPLPPSVELAPLGAFGASASGNFTATPDALILHAESGGRVTKTVKVGDKVNAGDIIASLDNSQQSAALISAEGALKAAQAGRDITSLGQAPAGTGLTVAQSSARTAIGAAYNFIDDAIRTKTDVGFLNPRNDDQRRFMIDIDIEYNQFVAINTERAAFNKVFTGSSPLDRMQDDSQLESLIKEEQANLANLNRYLVDLTYAWNKTNQHADIVTPDLIASQRATIAALRAALPQIQGQLAQAQSSLAQAKLAKDTNATATGASGTSAAQIEIAQGSLAAARSAYEKTIVRSPATGRVTGLNVHVGDVIAPGTNIALIAATGPIASGTYSLPLKAVKYDATETYVLSVVDGKTVSYPVKTGLLTSDSITVSILATTSPANIVTDVRGLKPGQEVTVKSNSAN